MLVDLLRRSPPRGARRVSFVAVLALALATAGCAARAAAGGEAIGESSRPAPRSNTSSTPLPKTATSAQPATPAPANESLEEKAARVHARAILVDGHDDIPTAIFYSGKDIADATPPTHTTLAKLKAGGVTGTFFSIFVDGDLAEKPTVTGGGSLRRAIDLVDITYRQIERHPNELLLATTPADIRRAKREGKVAVLMGIEGGHAIENSLGALRVLHRLGCRYMTLTHTNTNEWADSSGFTGPTPARHHGLTSFGEDVVREMQRLGMLVDISHVSDDTFNAVMRVAQAPVIASHSSSRAIADHRRNLTDDMLRALAKNGGVAMVNFWPMFISNEYAAAARAWNDRNGKAVSEIRAKHKNDPLALHDALKKLHESDPLPKVPLSVLIDHIDHMVKVAGVDHVGIGSDFDGVDALPDGIDGVDSFPKITLELLRRGYSEDDVLKILGGNFLRVFEKAEAYAQSTRTRLSGDGNTRRIDR